MPPPGTHQPRVHRRSRREFYRGEQPRGLKKRLLDEYIVLTRDWHGALPPSGYFDDEVSRASALAVEWGPTLLDGLTAESILAWIRCETSVKPDHAVALHAAGVAPQDIEWNYADHGSATLTVRLQRGFMTVEEVIEQVRLRRLQP